VSSPLFDGLHLKLARVIADPVASATSDGLQATSALRTDYLNRASLDIQNFFRVGDKTPDRSLTIQALQGLVKVQSVTAFVNTGFSVATDFSFGLWVDTSTPVRLYYTSPDHFTRIQGDPVKNYENCCTVYGNKLYGISGSKTNAVLNAGTGSFYYISTDQRTQANDSTDIAIDSLWYTTLTDLAASYFFTDTGNQDKAKIFLDRAVSFMKSTA
jgi:hypothetical protein